MASQKCISVYVFSMSNVYPEPRESALLQPLFGVVFVTICGLSETSRSLGAEMKVRGQKKGCIYGQEGVFDIGGQEKGCFSGREDTNKKETSSKECLCNYLVMRSLDYARDDFSKITYSAQ